MVTGSDGLPLAGVTVLVKGTNKATQTDTSGYFNINARTGDILLFSFVGYANGEIKVGKDLVLNITLSKSANNLNEVVVTGYLSEKIKDITGSITVVKSKELIEVPAGQVEQMLQGRVAGLNVITTGEPGSASNVRIHGIGNFGDVTPLYIIDGVQGDLNSINAYDIESLQVLKDADAYSVYGARGANGVIVVTTRKGKSGPASMSFDSYVGVQEPLQYGLKLLSPKEYGDLLWLADNNSGLPHGNNYYGYGPTPVMPDYYAAGPHTDTLFFRNPVTNSSLYNIDPNKGKIYQITGFNSLGTDWFHELFKPAFSQNYTISASGGNERNKFFFSLGWLDQQGTLINTYLKRITARINSEFLIKKLIRFGENLQLGYFDNPRTNQPGNYDIIDAYTNPIPRLNYYPNYNAPFSYGDVQAALLLPTYLPVHDIKGGWSSPYVNSFSGPMDNPVAVRELSSDNRSNSWKAIGNAFAELTFLKHFLVRTSIGGSFNFDYSYKYLYGSYASVDSGGYPNSFTETSGYLSSLTWTNTLNYSKVFSENHQLSILLGFEEIRNYNREQVGGANNFFTDDPSYRLLGNGLPGVAGQPSVYSSAAETTLSSLIGQFKYNYREKYYFSATLRRDGSSVFGPENRFGSFPSFGIAWRLAGEKFMRSSAWLNDLKLRASWGIAGFNGNTNPLNQYSLYNGSPLESDYDLFGTSNSFVRGLRNTTIGNAKTGWQQDIVTNIGLDAILWGGKLGFVADWYVKKSSGLLYQVPLTNFLGSTPIPPNVNVGDIENRGVDLQLTSIGNFSKKWRWDVDVTFTTYSNKILKINGSPFFDVNNLGTVGAVRNEVGHPMGSFFGYQIEKIFNDPVEAFNAHQPDAAPGRFKYLDANHDGHISTGDTDMVFIGNPNPKFTLGISIGISYMNFDISAFFYGSFGNDVLNQFKQTTDMFDGGGGIGKAALYNSWQPIEGKQYTSPIAEYSSNFSNSAVPNSFTIEKGSYFKNRSLMLGYSLSKNLLIKLKIDRLRFYLQAVNLFTITSYSGLDPEQPGNSMAFGIDHNPYPNNQKQYVFGCSLNF